VALPQTPWDVHVEALLQQIRAILDAGRGALQQDIGERTKGREGVFSFADFSVEVTRQHD